MAETLRRHSPLQGFATRFAALPGAAAVQEEPFLTMVDLWIDPSGPAASAAARALGVEALPAAPSTVVTGADVEVIWFGPYESLVTSTQRGGEELEARLREVLNGRGAAVDVSAQRTAVRLRGAASRDVLAKGCSIDLHPSGFGPRTAVQTMLGQANVVLMSLSDNGTDYRILVRSSFARYLAEWLIDASTSG